MPRIQFSEFFEVNVLFIDLKKQYVKVFIKKKNQKSFQFAIISSLFHLIISSIQQYQNYEKQEMKCIRKKLLENFYNMIKMKRNMK